MQSIVKHSLYLFLVITGLTAVTAIIGIFASWFYTEKELPHLGWLITAVIVEIVAVVVVIARTGLKYLPETQTDKKIDDTMSFMQNFISSGTSATIVSNRVSWLESNQKLIDILKGKIDMGINIEVIVPSDVSKKLRSSLQGATFTITNESVSPEARFTLINGDRSGAEKLAIARGVHPDHEITVFDINSGPQIIAMAKVYWFSVKWTPS